MKANNLLLAFLFFAVAAEAGHETGHGGISVVCRNTDDRLTVRSSELFDLWEGSQPSPRGHGFIIPKSESSVESQLEKAISKIEEGNPSFASQVRIALKQVRRDQIVYRDGPLPASNDVDPISEPDAQAGCFLEQLALYRDDDRDQKRLLINGEIFETLVSNTDQAAFFMHEAVYAVLRRGSAVYEFREVKSGRPVTLASNSRLARQIVAMAFSDEKFEKPNLTGAELHCEGPYFEFLIFPHSIEFLRMGPEVTSRVFTARAESGRYLVKRGLLAGKISILENESYVSIRRSTVPLEFFVHAAGSRLALGAEKVKCSTLINNSQIGQE